jgi:uncharacterized protein DUF3563
MILFLLCKLVSRPLPGGLGRRLGRLRREILPTDGERDAAYLGAAGDRHDLEFRIKELDRSGRRARGPFGRF